MLNQFGAVAPAALRFLYVERTQPGIQLATADKVVGDEPRTAEDLVIFHQQVPLRQRVGGAEGCG